MSQESRINYIGTMLAHPEQAWQHWFEKGLALWNDHPKGWFQTASWVYVVWQWHCGIQTRKNVWHISRLSSKFAFKDVALVCVVRTFKEVVSDSFNCDSKAVWTGWWFWLLDAKKPLVQTYMAGAKLHHDGWLLTGECFELKERGEKCENCHFLLTAFKNLSILLSNC